MKILVSPGLVQIPSAPGLRSFVNPLTARPPCFLNLWRDCTNMDAYLQFSNGAVYHYDSPSDDDVRAICNAFILGRTFNRNFRRSYNLGGGYEVFTGSLPSTAILIYSYPPYEGTDPGECPTLNFNNLVWDSPPDSDTPTGTGFNVFFNTMNHFTMQSSCPFADSSNATGSNSGQMPIMITADTPCNLALTLTSYLNGDPGLDPSAEIVVLDSTFTLFLNVFLDQTSMIGTQNIPFIVPATAVSPLIVGYSTNICFSGVAPAQMIYSGVFTPAM